MENYVIIEQPYSTNMDDGCESTEICVQNIDVVKVENDGKHLEQENAVITFLTGKGYRTPKYIWVGKSKCGIEMTDMTKKGCISKIERDNRLFSKSENIAQ